LLLRLDGATQAVIQAPKPEPRNIRYELSEYEWTAIKPMLPNKPRGVRRVNDRHVLNDIFWVLRSGAPWRDHRDFLAAGGLGILIGDGALNYRRERILETYYAYALTKQLTLTADYQLITNPAYNADRGPVHVFSGRFHGEF